MRRRVGVLVWKEFLELRQTPELLVLLLIAPIVQLLMLGYAATTDVKHVPIVVVDQDHTSQSRGLVEKFAASPHFQVVAEELDVHEVDRHLSGGTAWLARSLGRGD